MTRATTIRRRAAVPEQEEGYVLLTAIFFMALLVLSLAVAAPRIAKAIQRDRELETYHRGMQYRRAIQLYYRSFHAYPPTVDALVKTNEIRFLRKKYSDPMTGKNDWKPVLFGQNKTPTAMGFFGQPLSGNATTIAGVGPSGGNNSGGLFNSGSSSISSSSTGTSGSSQTSGTSSTTGGTSSTTGTGGSGSGASSSSSGFGGSQTFGGAGIIGFSPGATAQSILVYKKKNHFNEWEFTYDPISDMQTVGGGNTGTIGQPASSTTTPVGSSSSSSSGTGSGTGTSTNP